MKMQLSQMSAFRAVYLSSHHFFNLKIDDATICINVELLIVFLCEVEGRKLDDSIDLEP